jgi:hypothetical protein
MNTPSPTNKEPGGLVSAIVSLSSWVEKKSLLDTANYAAMLHDTSFDVLTLLYLTKLSLLPIWKQFQ